jgi:short-subunit dehydrogenase
MHRNLAQKRVLITGASRGIGRALAERAGDRGARLALTARNTDSLAELIGKLHSRGLDALAISADLKEAEDRARLLAAVHDRFGGLDVLINNAGVGSFGHFAESSATVLREVMELNFFAAAEMIRAAIPVLTEGVQPAVVNIASMCGRRGLPAWPEYSASKFALAGLTDALRGELARFDIAALLVLPGLTRTELASHMLRNEGRMAIDFSAGMPPEYVAERILRALEKGKREIVLGREAVWMLRINRWWPWLVDRLLQRKVRRLYSEEPAGA